MRIIAARSLDDLNEKSAIILISYLLQNPKAVFGFATGESPLGLYKKIIEFTKAGLISFKQAHGFNLDEYVGLKETNANSYHYYMQENLYKHIDMPAENIHIPNGCANDLEKECLHYEEKIRNVHGIDFQILGLGTNGHIGFNEPSDHFTSNTHLVTLSENTIKDNSRFFRKTEEVPTQAISMGIESIMRAKKILLICFGSKKKQAFYKMTQGSVTPMWPASILQLHADTTILHYDID